MNIAQHSLKVVFILTILTSCKKNYSCICDNVASNVGINGNGAGVYPISAHNKSRAADKCSEKSTYIPNTTPKQFDVYCKLK